jgi:hypothetical protein
MVMVMVIFIVREKRTSIVCCRSISAAAPRLYLASVPIEVLFYREDVSGPVRVAVFVRN